MRSMTCVSVTGLSLSWRYSKCSNEYVYGSYKKYSKNQIVVKLDCICIWCDVTITVQAAFEYEHNAYQHLYRQ